MKALTSRQKLFGSISLIAVMFSAPVSWAQVTISEEVTTEQETNGQDLTIDTTGIITVTTEGPAVTLNSDNALSNAGAINIACLLYTSPSPRDKRQSRMPSSA